MDDGRGKCELGTIQVRRGALRVVQPSDSFRYIQRGVDYEVKLS